MLKTLDVELTFAANGEEAVTLFKQLEPDIVFMDISMPKMDGKEATKAIRALEVETGRHVPIVAMTSNVEIARKLCLTWGTNCVITGPVDRFKEAVIAAVRAALAQEMVTTDDMVVVTAGVPFNTPGSTNILRVAPCAERLLYPADPE